MGLADVYPALATHYHTFNACATLLCAQVGFTRKLHRECNDTCEQVFNYIIHVAYKTTMTPLAVELAGSTVSVEARG